MTEQSKPTEEAPWWRFVPVSEYTVPAEPKLEVVRRGWSGLRERLRRKPAESAFTPPPLERLSPRLMAMAAAEPQWEAAVPALSAALAGWLAEEHPVLSTQVILAAPYSGVPEVLAAWARQQGWRVLDPPRPEQILKNDGEWVGRLERGDEVSIVVPHLEHLYFRHQEGLDLLRRFLDWLWASRRRCLVGCSTWAWAYLSKAIKLDTLFPAPWTLGPFGEEQLFSWLPSLASRPGGRSLLFRQANSGEYVLRPERDDPAPTTDFLAHVAAYGRGIPGVVWAVWRQSLRHVPEDDLVEKNEDVGSEASTFAVWVEPWSGLSLPSVPAAVSRDHLFVLHALLLHGDLPARLLPELLPVSYAEAVTILRQLAASGLVAQEENHWRVVPLAYPAVRHRLATEGYLIDFRI